MNNRVKILIIILVVAIMGIVIAIAIKNNGNNKDNDKVTIEDNGIEEREKTVDEDDYDTTGLEEDDDSEEEDLDDNEEEPDDDDKDEEGFPFDGEEESDKTDKDTVCKLLKSKGYNNKQVAAIMANMRNESNFNSKMCGDYNGNVPTSFGLLLWHNNRFNELIKYSGETKDYKEYNGDYCINDYPFSSMDMQINFLEHELNNSYARVKTMLEQDKTVKELIFDFCKYYVVPAGSDIICDSRSLQADDIYDYVTKCQ